MRWRTVLFDFDGTIFDTVEGITKSAQYALAKHGIQEPLDRLRCFAGPPLAEKFMEVYGVTQPEAEQLVAEFRERYVPIGVYESSPFSGIKELLIWLRQAGLKLGVATSKPQALAELLLERANMKDCFDVIVGSAPGPGNDQKWQIVQRALALSETAPEAAVLVGDTKYDAIGAARCEVACLGVAWGYGAPGELEAAGVLGIAADPAELEGLLTAEALPG